MNETFSGEWLDKFLEVYPANSSEGAGGAFNAQWTDRSIIGTWFWSQLWTKGASSPVYNYIWDHAPPGQDRGAYHESESKSNRNLQLKETMLIISISQSTTFSTIFTTLIFPGSQRTTPSPPP